MHHIDFDSFWPGYDVSVHSRCTKQITLALEPRTNHLPLCGKCHQPCPLIHDRRMRLVRDRDLFELRVRLQVPIRRVDCLTVVGFLNISIGCPPAPDSHSDCSAG